MKKLIISHGTRHRARQLRRGFRELRHADDATLSRGRDGADEKEYREWLADYTDRVAPLWDPALEFDLHLRLLAGLCCGLWADDEMVVRVDPMIWTKLTGLLSDDPSLPEESAPPQPLPSEELVDELFHYFSAFRDPKIDPRSMIGISSGDVRRLMDYRNGEPVWRHDDAMDNALAMVVLMEPFWLRPLKDWPMPEVCDRRTFASLLQHLFVLYPVPDFLLGEPWFSYYSLPKWKWVMWLVLLGSGASLPRAGRVLGWWANTDFVKLLTTCGDVPAPEDACLVAEVLRKGGTRELADAFCMHPAFHIDPTEVIEATPANQWVAGREDAFREFWGLTLDWMIRHQAALPRWELTFVLAWAQHQFTAQRERGRDFTWKGRTPASTLRAAGRFAATQPELKLLRSTWPPHGWDWGCADADGTEWTLREVTGGMALKDEGMAMHHCVGGYISSCLLGDQAIFSLRKAGERMLTISVTLPSAEIGQAQGKFNRMATAEELGLVNRWRDEVLKPDSTLP